MRQLSRKKFLSGIIIVFISYVLLRCRKYEVKFSATIGNAKPLEIWEYVSDFSNMKTLNPTINSFVIESESGNYGHWKYKVYYTEFLSQLPFLNNFAWADYEAKILSKNKYAIYSTHKTCFLTSLTCVHTDAVFLVEPAQDASDSTYTELIAYECPAIFSFFCKREVLHQRNKIRDNLIQIFRNRERSAV